MTATLFPLDDRQQRLLAGEAVWSTSARVATRSPPGQSNALLVYIGVGVRGGWRESAFHNPFRLQDHGRDDAIRLYRENLERRLDLMRQLRELCGRALGCWCWPRPCHGDVLRELVNRR